MYIRQGAEKSLARPGRKQTTVTKLGIYSTYSPWSSIHFLACCSNFCKPLKKNSEGCPSKQVSAAAVTSMSDEKWWPFNCFFSPGKQVVVRWGQIQRIGWVIKTVEAKVGQFLLGCKCTVSRVTVVQEQDPLGDLPAPFFLQNVLQLHQQRWVILLVDSLALWKINEKDAVLIPKNWDENFSSGFLHLEFFGAGWAAMPPLHWLLLCLQVIVI